MHADWCDGCGGVEQQDLFGAPPGGGADGDDTDGMDDGGGETGDGAQPVEQPSPGWRS